MPPCGWEEVLPQPDELPFRGDTIVGNDVWIGYESLVMPGVQIGHGAIVAAGSVVVTNVKPYTVVGGNPAKPIEERFAPEIVQELLRIAWCDWSIEKVTRNLRQIVSADIEALCRAS